MTTMTSTTATLTGRAVAAVAAAASGDPAVETRDLSIYYGSFRAVRGVNLRIPPRKVTAIIGPSGCGKSTLLRSLNRMNETLGDSHVTGEVFFHGQSIYGVEVDPVELRRRIGMVFQRPNPFPKSIYENVAWGARINGYRGDMNAHVERCLAVPPCGTR